MPSSELRWHPLLRQWVSIAAHRQGRPQLPEDWCPFCPGSGRVPENYDVHLYPNDFPAFSLENPLFSPEHELFATTGARGACDVVLYSPDHRLLPSQLTAEQWATVIDLWSKRTEELSASDDVQYVSVFENTGLAIGVTMPHPHGQIYAFPFIPPLVSVELDSAADHYRQHGECLYCRILASEIEDGRRIVATNESFVAFLPFFGRFPSEMQICSRRHFERMNDLTATERTDLAGLLKTVRQKYDNLYGFPMPLMMLLRQSPAKGEHPYFHFHIDFLPIQRSATKLKYLAAVESGNGTFLNDTSPEEQAVLLREAGNTD
ncbi:MAG TPA: galactose-1-phosphate uridylyltransferase [Bryobacteraceae bacterium]|nr:galactose-1-phosphate uridylyltransferase [Bryobacteraceae bacterium]